MFHARIVLVKTHVYFCGVIQISDTSCCCNVRRCRFKRSRTFASAAGVQCDRRSHEGSTVTNRRGLVEQTFFRIGMKWTKTGSVRGNMKLQMQLLFVSILALSFTRLLFVPPVVALNVKSYV